MSYIAKIELWMPESLSLGTEIAFGIRFESQLQSTIPREAPRPFLEGK